ncbi:MAG: hypothetical protein ACRDL7_01910, partial [Gaiellaceae bacterium]
TDGTPEQFLLWKTNLQEIQRGKNLVGDQGAVAFNGIICALLGGMTLNVYRHAMGNDPPTQARIEQALTAVAKHLFPLAAYQQEKAFLQYDARKNINQSVNDHAIRFRQLNDYLSEFPLPESVNPATAKLATHDLKQAFFRSLPPKWKKHMKEHHDITLLNFDQVLAVAQRLESTEEQFGDGPKAQNQKREATHQVGGTNQNTGREPKRQNRGEKPGKPDARADQNSDNTNKWCKLHGYKGHTTDECEGIDNWIEQTKSNWKSNAKSNRGGRGPTNGKDGQKNGNNSGKKRAETNQTEETNRIEEVDRDMDDYVRMK